MAKPTGPGKYFFKVDPTADILRAWLFNFDIDGATLKGAHIDLLSHAIGPVIRDGGSIKLLGLASTTGSVEHDEKLGESRVESVHTFLVGHFGNRFHVAKQISFGKEMALAFGEEHLPEGTGDNKESEVWRGVVINAWNRGTAPPPPVPSDVPFNNSTWSSTLDASLTGASFAVGIVDLAADLAGVGALAAVTGPLGLAIAVIQSIVAMPLLWASTDALAETNGEIQGAADAIQDMADQYSDPGLDRTPLSKWPAIAIPTPHLSTNPQPSASQSAWSAGQLTGLKNAVQMVLDLEQNPKPITLPAGQHIRLTGRIWLRAISKAFKDNAGVEAVVKPANEELRKRGKPPFPTH